LTPAGKHNALKINGFFCAEFFGKVTKILQDYRVRALIHEQSTKLSTVFGDNLKKLNKLEGCCVFQETTRSIKPLESLSP
jgi:hypothetical protein